MAPDAPQELFENSDMGRRKKHTGYTGGYAHVQYCTWAHGGVPTGGGNGTSAARREKVLIRKRQKNFEQFVKEPAKGESSDDLCASCRTIDFKRIFSLDAADLSDHGLPVLSLNYLTPKLLEVHCLACSLFASMAFDVEDTWVTHDNKRSACVEWHIRAFPASCLWGVRTSSGQVQSIILSLVGEYDSFSHPFPETGLVGVPEELDHAMLEDSWRRDFIVPTSAITQTSIGHGVSCCGTQIQPSIDYKRIKELLADCTKYHLECANYNLRTFPRGARVINCHNRAIVDLVIGMEYLALSYVWGCVSTSEAAQVVSMREQTMYLVENAPRTIEDAIMVTKALGYDYLWIDRYCIRQHNNSEKQDQIQQMASIYSRAVATICATGEDSTSGLYGVSKARRVQHTISSQGMVMVKSPWPEYHIREHLKQSRWATRGWTYQEPLLSKNCLFFTPETVVQVCHTRTFAEALSVEYNLTSCFTNRTVVLSSSLFMPRLPLCMSAILPREQLAFTQAVQQYQKRNFSYDTDSLDAFKGFLSMIQMASYWGVPIVRIEPGQFSKDIQDVEHDHRPGFIFGLLWSTAARQDTWNSNEHWEASPYFPSWSWVSRRAVLTDFLHHGGVLKSAKIRSFHLTYWKQIVLYSARVHIEKCDGKLADFDELVQDVQNVRGTGLIKERSKFLVVAGVTARWRLGTTRFGDRTTGKLRSARFPTVLLEDVTDPAIQPYLAQLIQAGPARIAFDQGYAVDPSTDLERHADAPVKKGLAILLLITG